MGSLIAFTVKKSVFDYFLDRSQKNGNQNDRARPTRSHGHAKRNCGVFGASWNDEPADHSLFAPTNQPQVPPQQQKRLLTE